MGCVKTHTVKIVIPHRNDRRRKPTKDRQVKILESQKGKCFYCGSVFGEFFVCGVRTFVSVLQWDHLLPYSYVRNNHHRNFVAACNFCNAIKSNKVFDSIEEAREYVQKKRSDKGMPVSKVRVNVSQKKAMAKVLFKKMPLPKVLGKPRNYEKGLARSAYYRVRLLNLPPFLKKRS